MTVRQQKAIAHILEGDSARQAMLKAGYRENVADNPKNLTETKVFKDTLEKLGISDEKLATVLGEGLEATKPIVMGIKSEESFVDVIPDHPTRHKFLETALKLKGYSKDEGVNNTIIPILVKFVNGKDD